MCVARRDARHRMLGSIERHCPILRVASAERGQRPLSLATVRYDVGATAYEEIGEGGPVLGIVVDDQSNSRVLCDVAHALER